MELPQLRARLQHVQDEIGNSPLSAGAGGKEAEKQLLTSQIQALEDRSKRSPMPGLLKISRPRSSECSGFGNVTRLLATLRMERNGTVRTPYALCHRCNYVLTQMACYEDRISTDDVWDQNHFPMGDLPSLVLVKPRACHLCAIVRDELHTNHYQHVCRELLAEFDVALRQHMQGPPYIRQTGKVSLVLVHRTDLDWRGISKIVLPNIFHFEPQPKPEMDYTASDKSAVTDWFTRCSRNTDGKHAACIDAYAPWLPTRVLDISAVRWSGVVRLITSSDLPSDQRKASYATLSHAWGP